LSTAALRAYGDVALSSREKSRKILRAGRGVVLEDLDEKSNLASMLMKPKKWLAYTIEVNDLLPAYERIVERFERSDIPLDGAFGSNTTPGVGLPGVLLAIGPAVEPARLAEVIALLTEFGQLFILVHEDGTHDKFIFIGALNLDGEPVTAVGGDVLSTIMRKDATVEELRQSIENAPKVHVIIGRDASTNKS
jgi:hypothetical protein